MNMEKSINTKKSIFEPGALYLAKKNAPKTAIPIARNVVVKAIKVVLKILSPI